MNENLGYEESYKQPDLECKIETNKIKALKNLAIGTGIAAVVGLGSLFWINRDKLNLDNLEKMTTGRISLTPDETAHGWILAADPKFQYSKGKNKGKPNYRLITKEINDQYWNGDNVRSTFMVKLFVNDSYEYSKPSKKHLECFKRYNPGPPVDITHW